MIEDDTLGSLETRQKIFELLFSPLTFYNPLDIFLDFYLYIKHAYNRTYSCLVAYFSKGCIYTMSYINFK